MTERADARVQRRRRFRRVPHALRASAASPVALVLAGCIAVSAPLLLRPAPLLVWNASASAPTGLYAITRGAALRTGEIVLAWAPPDARRLAAERHYLPFGVPLVKPVAAAAGDRVCALGNRMFINGRLAVLRRRADPSGRPLPWWSGCRSLGAGELFLLSRGVPEAFDGRYFGITCAADVIGRATPLWLD